MRDGLTPAQKAGEKEIGRKELQEALREEERAGNRRASSHQKTGHVLYDRATTMAALGLSQPCKEKRGRKRSRRSSSSGSESVALVDRHGVSQLSKVAERRPGYLAGESLKKMREYLAVREVGSVSGGTEEKFR
eukprot:39663-Amphidinium_carterae.1